MALLRSEVGASLVEYSMLIAMIAIVTVISITAVGSATARNRHYARRDWVRITGNMAGLQGAHM
jgi:hypothetical protein